MLTVLVAGLADLRRRVRERRGRRVPASAEDAAGRRVGGRRRAAYVVVVRPTWCSADERLRRRRQGRAGGRGVQRRSLPAVAGARGRGASRRPGRRRRAGRRRPTARGVRRLAGIDLQLTPELDRALGDHRRPTASARSSTAPHAENAEQAIDDTVGRLPAARPSPTPRRPGCPPPRTRPRRCRPRPARRGRGGPPPRPTPPQSAERDRRRAGPADRRAGRPAGHLASRSAEQRQAELERRAEERSRPRSGAAARRAGGRRRPATARPATRPHPDADPRAGPPGPTRADPGPDADPTPSRPAPTPHAGTTAEPPPTRRRRRRRRRRRPAAIALRRAPSSATPYRWGAAGPDAWDCSGLTMGAWQAGGVSLPHYSVAQYDASTPISGRRPAAGRPGLLGLLEQRRRRSTTSRSTSATARSSTRRAPAGT